MKNLSLIFCIAITNSVTGLAQEQPAAPAAEQNAPPTQPKPVSIVVSPTDIHLSALRSDS